ncbi:MAG: serine hydrolase [Bacteroidetes bacterium]|nr:serine hydrolase [Bacteroidota bacterium]MBT4410760.1 serine hydrolase [Bacteroidota bacterium]MBT7465982.1 serine hydrolase [Bacteroidota bacterium]
MRRILIVVIVLFGFGCQNKVKIMQSPVDLNDGINVSTVKKHNIDTLLLSKVNLDIYDGKYGNIHSLLVMKDDELIVEQYYRSGDRDEIHFIMSVTKAFTSILTGIALENGFIDTINQSMLHFFPEYKISEKDKRKHQTTIEHLLTMTSGFKYNENLPLDDPRNDGTRIENMDNWLKGCLSLKMNSIPGTEYVYCGANCVILSEVIRVASKKDIAEFAEEYLFKPLKIEEYKWYGKSGFYEAGGGLYIKSRDMIKFGQLHLNGGVFDNTRIVSQNWIDKTFTPYIKSDKPDIYVGYNWDILKSKEGLQVYFRGGRGGQAISLIQDLNMIIVVTADNRKEPQSLAPLMEQTTKIHPDYKSKTTTPNSR